MGTTDNALKIDTHTPANTVLRIKAFALSPVLKAANKTAAQPD